MTGAAGTTQPKEDTFGGTTALMVPITTLIEETSGSLGALMGSGTLWYWLMVLMKCWRSLRTVWWVLKSSFGPGVLEEPEAVFTESPTGIAYGTSVLFLPSFPSGLDALVLVGWS